MSVKPGQTLSHYRLTEKIGEGGMGVVYRARDTRLDRDVALKLLPREFSESPERIARFEREAKAVAALSHPNILAIHDFGKADRHVFAVMELLNGETLRQKLDAGPLPPRKAQDYCSQIALGLGAAHGQGIVHRDLKPDNIFVTRDGTIKILDFGLAKRSPLEESDPSRSDDTRTSIDNATSPGTVLGTVGYMSPEQVRGSPADTRSDIFSLGVTLFEMLSGRRAFARDSAVETMNAILKEDPLDTGMSGSTVAPAMSRILYRCLEKQPEQRFQSAQDLAFAIGSLARSADTSTQAATDTPERKGGLSMWLVSGVLAALAGAALSWAVMTGLRPGPSALFMDLDLGRSLDRILVPQFSVSPDGRSIVFAARDAGLFVRRLDRREATPLAGTLGAWTPTYSPDGKWIAFMRDQTLQRTPAEGGAVLTITEAGQGAGQPFWAEDGTILYSPNYSAGIWKIPAEGGRAEEIIPLDRAAGESSLNFPQSLPDGRGLIYTVEESGRTFEQASIVARRSAAEPPIVIVEGGTYGRYVPSGHILYVQAGALWAAPFDLAALELKGTPMQVESGILSTFAQGSPQLAVSDGGTLAWVPWEGPMRSMTLDRLVEVAPDGTVTPVIDKRAPYLTVQVSPDQRRLLVVIRSSNDDAWIVDRERGTQMRITFEAENADAVWLPDGQGAVVCSNVDGDFNLHLAAADGRGMIRQLTTSPHRKEPTSVSPDGRQVAYSEMHPETGADIWLLPLVGDDPPPQPFRVTPFNEDSAVFSPDGRAIAYVSDESGRQEGYLQELAGSRERIQVTVDGAYAVRWSPSGKELFYANPAGIFSVPVRTSPRIQVGAARLRFRPERQREETVDIRLRSQFDVLSDDGRLVLIEVAPEESFTRLRVALNWFSELERTGLEH